MSQFSRDQLLFIDESAKRWQDFSGKYQYNQLCKRENILRNICCGPDDDRYFKNTKSFASLQERQEEFCRCAIYGMIDGSRNTIFAWWKTPNGRVKLKTVVIRFLFFSWFSEWIQYCIFSDTCLKLASVSHSAEPEAWISGSASHHNWNYIGAGFLTRQLSTWNEYNYSSVVKYIFSGLIIKIYKNLFEIPGWTGSYISGI